MPSSVRKTITSSVPCKSSILSLPMFLACTCGNATREVGRSWGRKGWAGGIAHFQTVGGQRVQSEAQVLRHPDVVRILPGEPLQALPSALQLLQCFGTIAQLLQH